MIYPIDSILKAVSGSYDSPTGTNMPTALLRSCADEFVRAWTAMSSRKATKAVACAHLRGSRST